MLGDLSARYESNGNPGTVSDGWGDAGGKSYGTYQFASNAGVPAEFVQWLIDNGHHFGAVLRAAGEPGTAEFDDAWGYLAENQPEEFAKMQYRYTKAVYYDRAAELLEEVGYHLEKHSQTIRQIVWSAAVQYSARWLPELFETATTLLDYPNVTYVDDINFDERIIPKIYEVRATDEWTDGSPALRPGLRERFANECADALVMLAEEMGE